MDVSNFLKNSVYYPACEFDGTPIKFLGGKISNFVYADYMWNCSDLEDNIATYGLKGYALMAAISIEPELLFGCNWDTYLEKNKETGKKIPFEWENPFAKLFSFKRDNNLGDEYGKENISILFIKSEGISAYKFLYSQRNIVPKCLVSINPGLGFGCNYSEYVVDFTELLLSCDKLPPYQFYDNQCADYFRKIICHYTIIQSITHFRHYHWSSHFHLAKLKNRRG